MFGTPTWLTYEASVSARLRFFYGSHSNFRVITRLETLVLQATTWPLFHYLEHQYGCRNVM